MAKNPDWVDVFPIEKMGIFQAAVTVSLPEGTNEMFGEAMWFALKDDDFGRYHWPQPVDGLMSVFSCGGQGRLNTGAHNRQVGPFFWDAEITNLTHLGWDFLELYSSTVIKLYTFCWICKKMVAKNHRIYDCIQKWRIFISIMIFST